MNKLSFKKNLMFSDKQKVKKFWEEASCGEKLHLESTTRQGYEREALIRYKLEPYILDFADFKNCKGKKVLEIGVGLGADHQKFAECGSRLYGIDLTHRSIQNVQRRFKLFNLKSNLRVGDAEHLPFRDNFFDIVYAWGVLHHSPDTPKAVEEIYRVLKPGGEVRAMIYHTYSFIGYMLWIRYALLRLRPFQSLRAIYARYLESPGTKAYTLKEARKLFSSFRNLKMKTQLTHGDLLSSDAGQRHQGPFLSIARLLWPRRLIQFLFPNHGLFLMIKGSKPSN